jgi:hypothetical protein
LSDRVPRFEYARLTGLTQNVCPTIFKHERTGRKLRSLLKYPSRAPVFSCVKGFCHFPLYGRSGKLGSAFSGRTFCQLAPQKDDYQSAILKIVFFGVPNP